MDQHRVAAEPAEPRAPRQLALEHGSGVHVRARRGQLSPDLRLEPPQQREELRLDELVVVAAARVAGDDGARRVRGHVVVIPGIVVLCDDERRTQLGPRRLRIQASFDRVRPGEVAHRAVAAGIEPRAVERGVVARSHGRDAGAVEAELQRARLEPRGEVRSGAFHRPAGTHCVRCRARHENARERAVPRRRRLTAV